MLRMDHVYLDDPISTISRTCQIWVHKSNYFLLQKYTKECPAPNEPVMLLKPTANHLQVSTGHLLSVAKVASSCCCLT